MTQPPDPGAVTGKQSKNLRAGTSLVTAALGLNPTLAYGSPRQLRSQKQTLADRSSMPAAKNKLMPCSKQVYSITWSARSNMEVGIVRMSTARLQGHHKM